MNIRKGYIAVLFHQLKLTIIKIVITNLRIFRHPKLVVTIQKLEINSATIAH